MVDFKKTAAISLSALALAATAPLSASAFAAHPAWRGAAVHSAAYYPHGWHGGWGGPFALGALAGAALAAPFSYGGACDPYYGCGDRSGYSATYSPGYAYGYGYGYYPDDPNYRYIPRGGNSGGANFPHSGT